MLTEPQIEKLRALTVSQRYGKFLEDAIKTWTSGINFLFKDFGIRDCSNGNEGRIFKCENGSCCLIGAALIGKETDGLEGYCDAARKIFNDDVDFGAVYEGFDDCDNINRIDDFVDTMKEYADSIEDFMFGVKIGRILKKLE